MTTLHATLAAKVESIIRQVCDETQVHHRTLLGRSRMDRTVRSRHLAMTLIRENTNLSLMEIGDLFTRDHGTVMHAIKTTNNRMENDQPLAAVHAAITSKIRTEPTP